jgi:hypothetical protein
MQRHTFKIAWLAVILLTAGAACNFITGISDNVQSGLGTAGAAATQVNALASQARGLATSVEESGFLKTAQALATGEGGQLLATAQALATQAKERGVLETAQAFATEEGSSLLATVRVAATQGVRTGSAPEDIPVVEEDTIVNFYGSESVVSYLTSLDFESVLDFYENEMPANGWQATSQVTVETNAVARMKYGKVERTADILVNVNPLDQKTMVTILLQDN